jgi:hypothetical protein
VVFTIQWRGKSGWRGRGWVELRWFLDGFLNCMPSVHEKIS